MREPQDMACRRLITDNDHVSSRIAASARTAYRGMLALLAVVLLTGCLVAPQAGRGTLAPTPPGSAPTATATRADSSSLGVDPDSGLPWVAASSLPASARQTLARIEAGGPYPYPRNDDQVFGNRERLLPAKPSGYYREYTVVTAGAQDRGPRRIVAGRGGERYYTEDHYQSYRRIKEGA